MIIVSNTTPLIGLASIRQFDLLKKLFGEIYIPQAVFDEIFTEDHKDDFVKKAVSKATWIKTVKVKDRLAVEVLLDELDLGEAETIVLACEISADWVLMDEKKGRRKLKQLGSNKIGTLGILIKAKQLGFLPVIRPNLERLCQKGFRLSQKVIESTLKQVGE